MWGIAMGLCQFDYDFMAMDVLLCVPFLLRVQAGGLLNCYALGLQKLETRYKRLHLQAAELKTAFFPLLRKRDPSYSKLDWRSVNKSSLFFRRRRINYESTILDIFHLKESFNEFYAGYCSASESSSQLLQSTLNCFADTFHFLKCLAFLSATNGMSGLCIFKRNVESIKDLIL